MRSVFTVLLALVLLSPMRSFALDQELRDLYTGARAQAMGNAFTAVADDEQALFYNPAGLAGNKKVSIHYLTLDTELSGDAFGTYTGNPGAFSNPSISTINSVIGTDVYARAMVTPTILLPNMAFALIADEQIAILSANQALPQITLGLQTTTGIQAGYGFSFSPGRLKMDEIRVGFGGKLLWRRGGYHDLNVTSLISLSQNELNSLTGSYGTGYGFDAGMQYIHTFSPSFSAMAGLASEQIGGVTFSESTADTQPNDTSAGLAVKYKMALTSVLLAYDYRNITQTADAALKQHFGIEVKVPFISIEGGLSQGYPTYGTSFDLWLFRVSALVYQQEQDAIQGQSPERRYRLRLDMKFDL